MSASDLQALCLVSKAFYIYANDEDLWKNLAYEKWLDEWRFKGTWRTTTLLPRDSPKRDSLSNRLKITGFYSALLSRHWYMTFVDLSTYQLPLERQTIERINADDLSLEDFNARFASQNKPVLIVGGCKKWPAMQRWQLDSLEQPPYGPLKWRTTDILPDGRRLYCTMDQFVEYMKLQNDEDPIYLFDGRFDNRPHTGIVADDYWIPEWWPIDALGLMSHPLKKPKIWRWLVIGPARSSSGFHLDPMTSSAWNAVVVGHKRWALYPPNFPYPPGTTREWDAEDKKWVNNIPEPLEWYVEHYPHLSQTNFPYEVVQGPGDVLFVPCGWWHSVLNLDNTVSVTHNFCDEFNCVPIYSDIERQCDSDDDAVDFLRQWNPQLQDIYPEIWDKIQTRPNPRPLIPPSPLPVPLPIPDPVVETSPSLSSSSSSSSS